MSFDIRPQISGGNKWSIIKAQITNWIRIISFLLSLSIHPSIHPSIQPASQPFLLSCLLSSSSSSIFFLSFIPHEKTTNFIRRKRDFKVRFHQFSYKITDRLFDHFKQSKIYGLPRSELLPVLVTREHTNWRWGVVFLRFAVEDWIIRRS